MLTTLIKELAVIVQDKKLPFQVGCVMTVFAIFDASRFFLSDEIMYGIRTIGYLITASAFFIASEIRNSANRGKRMRYWVIGIGICCSVITGIFARHYS